MLTVLHTSHTLALRAPSCPAMLLNGWLTALMCRFLNTIIDDLFAFVIKMPALHRLSVFRDDLGAWVSVSTCQTPLCVLPYSCPVPLLLTSQDGCAVQCSSCTCIRGGYTQWTRSVPTSLGAHLCGLGQHVLGQCCWDCATRSTPQISSGGCCPCVMLAQQQSGCCTCCAGTRPRQRRQPPSRSRWARLETHQSHQLQNQPPQVQFSPALGL